MWGGGDEGRDYVVSPDSHRSQHLVSLSSSPLPAGTRKLTVDCYPWRCLVTNTGIEGVGEIEISVIHEPMFDEIENISSGNNVCFMGANKTGRYCIRSENNEIF